MTHGAQAGRIEVRCPDVLLTALQTAYPDLRRSTAVRTALWEATTIRANAELVEAIAKTCPDLPYTDAVTRLLWEAIGAHRTGERHPPPEPLTDIRPATEALTRSVERTVTATRDLHEAGIRATESVRQSRAAREHYKMHSDTRST